MRNRACPEAPKRRVVVVVPPRGVLRSRSGPEPPTDLAGARAHHRRSASTLEPAFSYMGGSADGIIRVCDLFVESSCSNDVRALYGGERDRGAHPPLG